MLTVADGNVNITSELTDINRKISGLKFGASSRKWFAEQKKLIFDFGRKL